MERRFAKDANRKIAKEVWLKECIQSILHQHDVQVVPSDGHCGIYSFLESIGIRITHLRASSLIKLAMKVRKDLVEDEASRVRQLGPLHDENQIASWLQHDDNEVIQPPYWEKEHFEDLAKAVNCQVTTWTVGEVPTTKALHFAEIKQKVSRKFHSAVMLDLNETHYYGLRPRNLFTWRLTEPDLQDVLALPSVVTFIQDWLLLADNNSKTTMTNRIVGLEDLRSKVADLKSRLSNRQAKEPLHTIPKRLASRSPGGKLAQPLGNKSKGPVHPIPTIQMVAAGGTVPTKVSSIETTREPSAATTVKRTAATSGLLGHDEPAKRSNSRRRVFIDPVSDDSETDTSQVWTQFPEDTHPNGNDLTEEASCLPTPLQQPISHHASRVQSVHVTTDNEPRMASGGQPPLIDPSMQTWMQDVMKTAMQQFLQSAIPNLARELRASQQTPSMEGSNTPPLATSDLFHTPYNHTTPFVQGTPATSDTRNPPPGQSTIQTMRTCSVGLPY
jgi:hypothetical protein